MSDFTSSAHIKKFYRNPSILPAKVVEAIDRVIWPRSKTLLAETWMGVRMFTKFTCKVAAFVALLPLLAVMADPVFQGFLLDGNTLSFDEYQRFLQSQMFWGLTFGLILVIWPIYFYFNRLTIYLRDRQRAEQPVKN